MTGTPAGGCLERSGFLFAHDCDQPAIDSCSECNKPICSRHSRRRGASAGVLTAAPVAGKPRRVAKGMAMCVSCQKSGNEVRQRRRDSDQWDDDPYWYSSGYYDNYGYYDSNDYRVFDRPSSGAAGAEGFESDFDGS